MVVVLYVIWLLVSERDTKLLDYDEMHHMHMMLRRHRKIIIMRDLTGLRDPMVLKIMPQQLLVLDLHHETMALGKDILLSLLLQVVRPLLLPLLLQVVRPLLLSLLRPIGGQFFKVV